MKTLGDMIRDHRSETGETQAQVAKVTGMDRGTWIRYESDRSYPGVRQRKRVADWLGIELGQLPPEVPREKAGKAK